MALVAFDLDGTLLRGETVCEAIARGIGHLPRMQELERLQSDDVEGMTAAREEMAEWYSLFTFDELCRPLASIPVAPRANEGFALLHEHGFRIAVVSMTWEFAAAWFAKRLGADYSVGTGLSSDGSIAHLWPRDKATWLVRLAGKLGLGMADVSAVGDSRGDILMLLSVGHRYWVGQTVPPELAGSVRHDPAGDILVLAERIVEGVGHADTLAR